MPAPEGFRSAPSLSSLVVAERTVGVQSVLTRLGLVDGQLRLWEEGGEDLPLSEEALLRVFARYGAPLDVRGDAVAMVSLPGGWDLYHMLLVPTFDVVPKDYLVLCAMAGEPTVELAARLVPPLWHLARAARR